MPDSSLHDEATATIPLPVVPPAVQTVPVSPAESVELDEERAILEGIVPRKTKRGTTELGKFVASRVLEKPNVRESELLHHRAKVAFVDAAALTVPLYFNELGKPKPNATVLQGCQWAIGRAGIAVDSVPISAESREKMQADDRAAASMSNSELMARQSARLQAMNAKQSKQEDD